jgi:bisphosphoglycerate-independent phosphoglycerate mutase (AlkP superfamily)
MIFLNFLILPMDLRDVILSGNLSLEALSEMIDINDAQSKRMNLTLSWGYWDGKIKGRIRDKDKMIFRRFYKNRHTHISTAFMQQDFITIHAEKA